MIPGEIIYVDDNEKITLNAGRPTLGLLVHNTGDRPITVGSHCHFFETNPKLDFFRDETRGYRLHIPAGDLLRFEPGQTKQVIFVKLAGARGVE
ncbi:urease subunit beta [Streptomyces sp. x-80]|uniref:urease subunit beta n=1 Tax=Streptomyces sp. x-80 TaxID=2789282 RepID=UPI00398026E3